MTFIPYEMATLCEGPPTPGKERINMLAATTVRVWTERVLGVPVRLVIERVGDRNRVTLEVEGLGECEVAEMRALYRQRARFVQATLAEKTRGAFAKTA